ncbi:copper resistance protein CopC [Agrococcus lahaulensis]|nr:copper resistance protein CopC [Agrococcus lahaulensis]
MHAAIAALAAVLLLPAHASVIGSTPADGDTLTAQPGTFSVVMNEEILALEGADGGNAMQLTDAEGRFYGDGCLAVDGDTLSLDAELGEAGDYTLTYQVVSADGHPVDGTVAFAFELEAGAEGAPGAETAPVCGETAEETPAATEPAEPEATSDAPAATASADQGTGTEEPAEAEGQFPFVAVGILAVLGVLAVIAYTINRGSRTRRDRA